MVKTLSLWLFQLAILAASSGALLPDAVRAATPAPVVRDQCRTGSSRGNYILGELESLSTAAEEIYNLALTGKLDRVGRRVETLKKSAAVFEFIQDEASRLLLPRLARTISDLEKGLAAKNRLDAMRYANRITLIAATVAVPLKPCVPTEVALLYYNGRELEIWSEVKKSDKLSGIVIRMHLAWQTLMPKLIEQDGIKELRRFSDVMGKLELAKVPEEYGRLARQVLVEADSMKTVFAKPH